jgi:hypothetical protein
MLWEVQEFPKTSKLAFCLEKNSVWEITVATSCPFWFFVTTAQATLCILDSYTTIKKRIWCCLKSCTLPNLNDYGWSAMTNWLLGDLALDFFSKWKLGSYFLEDQMPSRGLAICHGLSVSQRKLDLQGRTISRYFGTVTGCMPWEELWDPSVSLGLSVWQCKLFYTHVPLPWCDTHKGSGGGGGGGGVCVCVCETLQSWVETSLMLLNLFNRELNNLSLLTKITS